MFFKGTFGTFHVSGKVSYLLDLLQKSQTLNHGDTPKKHRDM